MFSPQVLAYVSGFIPGLNQSAFGDSISCSLARGTANDIKIKYLLDGRLAISELSLLKFFIFFVFPVMKN